jgi:hypothetical protein
MGNIYKPIIKTDRHVVKFTRQQLRDALSALDRSGAQEIGIELELQSIG